MFDYSKLEEHLDNLKGFRRTHYESKFVTLDGNVEALIFLYEWVKQLPVTVTVGCSEEG